MGRKTEGTLSVTGKDKHFQLRYQYEGKVRKQVLRNKQGQYIYDKREAEKAAAIILDPLKLQDKENQAKLLQLQVDHAHAAVTKAKQEQRSSQYTIQDGWNKFLECPDRPECCLCYNPGDIPKGHTNAKNYYSYYKRFQEWCTSALKSKTKLDEITSADAQKFIQFLTAEKMTSGTVNKYITFFKGFYTVLIDAEHIKCPNPFSKIRKNSGTSARREAFTDNEVRRILNTAEGDYKVLFMLGLFAGMRLGDCCMLTWDMVDLNKQVINYVPRKTASTKKDSSQALVSVAIPDQLCDILSQRDLECTDTSSNYVLPEMARHYQANDEYINRRLNHIFDECNIQHIRNNTGQGTGKRAVVEKGFHSCRHWYASFCAEQGIAVQTVQQNLGHSSSAMTHYYTHTTDEAQQRTRKIMDEAMERLAPVPVSISINLIQDDELGEIVQPEFSF